MKTKFIIQQIVILSLVFLAGCSGMDWLFNPDVAKGVDAGGEALGLLGPWGVAGGTALTGIYGAMRGWYSASKAKGETATMSDKAHMAETALRGVVVGIQKAKSELPEEHLAQLHNGLEKHIPDWIHPIIDGHKGHGQEYEGRES